MRALLRRRLLLWPAFILVHLVVAGLCLTPGVTGDSFNDVTGFYRPWLEQAVHAGLWPAITLPWVYPILALVPMLLPLLGGHDGYGALWLVEVTALDAAAFGVLIAQNTVPRVRAAWFWLAAILALGPVALGRLDIVSVALAVLGVVVLQTRPWLAGVLLALGTWVKFWPAALVLAVVVAARERWKVLVGAAGTTAAVLLAGWAVHARFVLSFIGQQSGRGLQIESPFATPLLWQAAAGAHGVRIYYDTTIYTFQVAAPEAAAFARAADWAMPLAVAAAVLIGLRAALRRAEPRLATALLGLALTVAFCAFDKVGSPQYHAWFAVPVMLGLMAAPRRFRTPALLVLASTALTQVIYPWQYDALTGARAWMVALITVRNALELVLFAWALVALWKAGGRGAGRARGRTPVRKGSRT
jgi:hypothetical protein